MERPPELRGLYWNPSKHNPLNMRTTLAFTNSYLCTLRLKSGHLTNQDRVVWIRSLTFLFIIAVMDFMSASHGQNEDAGSVTVCIFVVGIVQLQHGVVVNIRYNTVDALGEFSSVNIFSPLRWSRNTIAFRAHCCHLCCLFPVHGCLFLSLRSPHSLPLSPIPFCLPSSLPSPFTPSLTPSPSAVLSLSSLSPLSPSLAPLPLSLPPPSPSPKLLYSDTEQCVDIPLTVDRIAEHVPSGSLYQFPQG